MIAGLLTFVLLGAAFGLSAALGLRDRTGPIVGLALVVALCLLAVVDFISAVQCFGEVVWPFVWLCGEVLGAFTVRDLVTVGYPVAGASLLVTFWVMRRSRQR